MVIHEVLRVLRTMWLVSIAVPAVPCHAAGDRATTTGRHEISIGAGGSSTSPFLQFSWTSRKRAGAYVKVFLLDDEKPVRANSTVVEESAGELGFAFRVNSWITLGAGFGQYSRETTVYGDLAPLFGVPLTLDNRDETDNGFAALVLLNVPTNSEKLRVAISVSHGPAGSGAALGITFRPGSRAP